MATASPTGARVSSTRKRARGSAHTSRTAAPRGSIGAVDRGSAVVERVSWLPVASTRRLSPAGVSWRSIVPHTRPAAGQRSTVTGSTIHDAVLPISHCHWTRPRQRPGSSQGRRAPLAAGRSAGGGRIVSPPVRSERLAVSTSAEEMSTLPLVASMVPAAVATNLGSMIRPRSISSSTTSAPARVTCHKLPWAASDAEASTVPPRRVAGRAASPTSATRRACQRARSPCSDQSTAIPVEVGAGRSHAPPRRVRPTSDGRREASTSAPPATVTSSRSPAAAHSERAVSMTIVPSAIDPAAEASIVISSSIQSGRPATSHRNPVTLPVSEAVAAPLAGARSSVARPRVVPARSTPRRSRISPASATSRPRSAVHWTSDDSVVPDADTSKADVANRASSTRSRSPRPAPRRDRSQPTNGSGQRSCLVPWATSRSLAPTRTSRTRSVPSARPAAAICSCPPATRTSGRTCKPPLTLRDAAARSMSTASAKSSPMSISAHSQAVP